MGTTPHTPPSAHPHKIPTSGLAIGSLICGILSLCTSIFTAIPAIAMGHMSMSQMKKSGGAIKGHSIALAGTILGYLSIALIPILAGLATPVILKAKKATDKAQLIAEVSSIGSEIVMQYEATNTLPPPPEMEARVIQVLVKNHASGDWLYFSQADMATRTPLLVSPFIEPKNETIMTWTDASTTTESESETSRILFETNQIPVTFGVTVLHGE